MGEAADGIEAEQTGQRLERVSRTKQPVDEIRIDFVARGPLVPQICEPPAHALDDLLRLGDELLIGLAGAP